MLPCKKEDREDEGEGGWRGKKRRGEKRRKEKKEEEEKEENGVGEGKMRLFM